MATPWPAESAIRSRLDVLMAACRAGGSNPPTVVDWSDTAYRFAKRPYADRDHFTDGEGARRSGGRFTPRGSHRTAYLSLTIPAAAAELASWYTYYKLPPDSFQPHVLAAVAVCVGRIVDLTAPETLVALGLSPDQIVDEWRYIADGGGTAPIQTLGRLIFEAGFEGIRYPSSREEGGVNFALFPDNYQDGSHALVLHID